MLISVPLAILKALGFAIVVASAITSFYAVIHAININTQLDVFLSGLVALGMGLFAGPLYCLVGAYALDHYLAYTELGAVLIVIPVFCAWIYMVVTLSLGWLRR